jgi:hypothetical protein
MVQITLITVTRNSNQVLTQVTIKSTVTWNVTACSLIVVTDISEERTVYIFRIEEKGKQEIWHSDFLIVGLSLDLIFDPEYVVSTFPRNVVERVPNYTMSHTWK